MLDSPNSNTQTTLEIFSDRLFPQWLAQEQISIAYTTYQTDRLTLLGVNKETGRFSGFERSFSRAMGLYVQKNRLYLGTKYQIWQLENTLEAGQLHDGYDKLYIPRVGYTTGDLDIHDIVVDGNGQIVFVCTMLNCLATLSTSHSCKPLWKPSFISRVINEDRCHLNGLALVDGFPRYVTACSQSDIVDGWRDRRVAGGCVIDVQNNEILVRGLSMPHSPRFYQGKLWLLNSGTGELGTVDLQAGRFEPLTFCPGFLRGLAFWKNWAIVGLSKPRHGDKSFSGLPLDETLKQKDADPRCGLMIIDISSGAIVHWYQIEGMVTELYDVQVLPGVQRPMMLGFQTEEIAQLISIESAIDLNLYKLNLTETSQPKQQAIAIRHHGVGGFFSNFNKVLNILSNYNQSNGYTVRVDWQRHGTELAFPYADRIGENAWDSFFEPLVGSHSPDRNEAVLEDYLDYSITNINVHQIYTSIHLATVRQKYHALYHEYVRVKQHILDEVEDFWQKHLAGYFCIGIHKRHVLHKTEEFYKKTVSPEDIFAVLQQFIPQDQPYKVFLATDESEAATYFETALGDRVIYQTSSPRVSVNALNELHWESQRSSSELGRAVLFDALLLARCQVLIHGLSNISTAVLFMNPNLKSAYVHKNIDRQIVLTIDGQPVSTNFLPSLSHPNSAEDYFDRSRLLKQQGEFAEAESCLREAVRLKPDFWGAWNNLGTLLQNQNRLAEALQCYETAIRHHSTFAEAIANRASLWQLDGELERAKTGYLQAIQLKPEYVPAHFNLATIYKQQRHLAAAVQHFQEVINRQPNYHEAHFALAQILEYQDQYDAADRHYQLAEQFSPTPLHISLVRSHLRLRFCNWQDYDRHTQYLIDLLSDPIQRQLCSLSPLAVSDFPVPLSLHRAMAEVRGRSLEQEAIQLQEKQPSLRFSHSRSIRSKLRIAYLSPDFREHAVGRLICQLFQHHDRERFEIFAYSTVDINDEITQQVRSGCDRYVDLSPLSTADAARRIHADGIDILIDLAGYTIGNLSAVLALQPAPIQIGWLGYPETMGASFIQYIMADSWLIPPEHTPYFSEEVIHLPHGFVSSHLPIRDQPFTRTELGLPAKGFIYCCFNSHYKINPPVFDTWMRILKQVPKSILWLTDGDETAKHNLRQSAQDRGVDPSRLIFASKKSHADYLAQFQVANLFLDTFTYNAGSTAAAAISAGLPLLTKPGESYAARMGASICASAGLESLICSSSEEYEQKAIAFGKKPSLLKPIQFNLQKNKETLPLFNIAQFVQNLEAIYTSVWDKWLSSRYRDFQVKADTIR